MLLLSSRGRVMRPTVREAFTHGVTLVVRLPRGRDPQVATAMRSAMLTLCAGNRAQVVLLDFTNVATRAAALWWLGWLHRAGETSPVLLVWNTPGELVLPWGVGVAGTSRDEHDPTTT